MVLHFLGGFLVESFLVIIEKKSMNNQFNEVNVVSKLFEMKMRISLETFV